MVTGSFAFPTTSCGVGSPLCSTSYGQIYNRRVSLGEPQQCPRELWETGSSVLSYTCGLLLGSSEPIEPNHVEGRSVCAPEELDLECWPDTVEPSNESSSTHESRARVLHIYADERNSSMDAYFRERLMVKLEYAVFFASSEMCTALGSCQTVRTSCHFW